MARDRQRVRLEDGLRLSLPRLMRSGMVRPGYRIGPGTIRWSYLYSDEEILTAGYTSEIANDRCGWIRLQADWIDQWIELRARPRHFGGRQWYFRCPYTGRDALTLWRPCGARDFAARQRWGRRVAYGSQFETPYDRALSQARKIRARIGGPGWESLDDPFPPKPKGMRWATYDRAAQRCDHYERIADARLHYFAARLLAR